MDKARYIGEDMLIKKADEIKERYFKEAEEAWGKTSYEDKKRPWPRCHKLNCNRTLECSDPCEGFDF